MNHAHGIVHCWRGSGGNLKKKLVSIFFVSDAVTLSMPVLDAGCGIEDNLRSLVDSCEDFWGNLCLEELSSSVPSLGFNFDWDDVESLLSDQATEPILTMDGDDGTDVLDAVKKEKNRKRRLNEAERLQKYSWERVVRSDDTP